MEKAIDNSLSIRVATPADASRLLEIYTPYVLNTAITYEYDVPTVDEFRSRITNTLKKYPYIVAVYNNQIVGYVYAGSFKTRAAYDWAVETSIYVDTAFKRKRIGSHLYNELESILKKMGVLNMNACIAYPEHDDEYLTQDSVIFHKHIGFSLVGEFHKCGCKFGRWYGMVWMEKLIANHNENPAKITLFPEL